MKFEIDDSRLVNEIVERLAERLKQVAEDSRKSNDDELFTVESLAKYLSVSKQWVYERVTMNEIPYIKMRKFPRFRRCVIDKWLDSMSTPAVQPLSNGLSNKLKMIKS